MTYDYESHNWSENFTFSHVNGCFTTNYRSKSFGRSILKGRRSWHFAI